MSTPSAFCPTCHAEHIPGLVACPNCGEAVSPDLRRMILGEIELPPDDELLPDYYTKPTTDSGTIHRALTEARALEYAGDLDTAAEIYERLTKTRTLVSTPYQRLAVLYRKRKAFADEERVVRLALAHIPSGPNSWFVVRLAKIFSEKRRREGDG